MKTTSKPSVFAWNGIDYEVKVLELTETGTVLSTDKSGRTQSNGKMYIDPIGTFFNYKIKVQRGPKCTRAEYDSLYNALLFNRTNGVWGTLIAPHNQTTITFKAYVTEISRQLLYSEYSNATYKRDWGEIEIEFVAKSPYILA